MDHDGVIIASGKFNAFESTAHRSGVGVAENRLVEIDQALAQLGIFEAQPRD